MSDLIGKMRSLVEIYENTPLQQGTGWKDNYQLIITTRGYLTKDRGNREASFSEIQGESDFTLCLRKQYALDNSLSMSLKFKINNEWYTIKSWEEVNNIVFYYRILVSKKNDA